MALPPPPPPPPKPAAAPASRPAISRPGSPAPTENSGQVSKVAAAIDVVAFLAAAAGFVVMLLEFLAKNYK